MQTKASRILLILACSFIGGLIAYLRVAAKTPEFLSMAKLATSPPIASSYTEIENYYSGITQIIKSAEMKKQCMERVSILRPELKKCDIQITVKPSETPAALLILAFGHEPKYTKAFLDAILDEFMINHANLSNREFAILEHASGAVEDVHDRTFPTLIWMLWGTLLGCGISAFISALKLYSARSSNS